MKVCAARTGRRARLRAETWIGDLTVEHQGRSFVFHADGITLDRAGAQAARVDRAQQLQNQNERNNGGEKAKTFHDCTWFHP